MPTAVRALLNARPRRRVVRHLHAVVDVGLRSHGAQRLVDLPVDAVVRDLVPRPERVRVVGKRPVVDAELGAGAVAAEAVGGVEDDGLFELAGVELLLPVAEVRPR